MEEQGKVIPREESVVELMDKQYIEADNRSEIDYWEPFARIIMEAIESRYTQGLSQADLACLMKTKQSVISRFENMGRKPNYDFIARLSIALGHSPGITLYGEYMAVVPQDKQALIKHMAAGKAVPTQRFVEQLLVSAINAKMIMEAPREQFISTFKPEMEVAEFPPAIEGSHLSKKVDRIQTIRDSAASTCTEKITAA